MKLILCLNGSWIVTYLIESPLWPAIPRRAIHVGIWEYATWTLDLVRLLIQILLVIAVIELITV